MSALRQLAIFIFPVLLAGCVSGKCGAPGQSCSGDSCFYKLHVKGTPTEDSSPPNGKKVVVGFLPKMEQPQYYTFKVSDKDAAKLNDNIKDPTLAYTFKNTCPSPLLELVPQARIEHFLLP